MYPVVPALSFITAALTLVPLMWYFQARNIAAMAIGIWLSFVNLIYAVDALAWAKGTDINIEGLVWCDISTILITSSRIALPAACLSICFHLERLASFCPTSTPQAKRRRIIFECVMCFGLPIVYAALHLIVQPRRFDLFYGFGCRPTTYPTVATIFLVTIPPLLLTAATIACVGIAWRHFLIHGIQFCGKRGSVSSLTRNLYIRLVGMALLEAALSAVLVSVATWNVLSPGLSPIGDMSRRLSDVHIWGPRVITTSLRTVLEIERSVTMVQSTVFFALFACRMEALRQGREVIQSFFRFFRRRDTLEQGSLSQSLTGVSVPTLPITMVDLSLCMESASTLTPYIPPVNKSRLSTPGASRPPSFAEETPEDVVISVLPKAMIAPESPSRVSTLASSHNSLESNFDPSQLVLSPDMWPRTPTTIPVHFARRFLSVGCTSEHSWLEVDYDDMPLPQVKPAAHVRSCTVDVVGKLAGCMMEKQQAEIHVTVVKEIH